jgi:predicted amino acid racemase
MVTVAADEVITDVDFLLPGPEELEELIELAYDFDASSGMACGQMAAGTTDSASIFMALPLIAALAGFMLCRLGRKSRRQIEKL